MKIKLDFYSNEHIIRVNEKKENNMIETCGHCKYFTLQKSKFALANAYWLGDGKCTKVKAIPEYLKATVIGETCKRWEEK